MGGDQLETTKMAPSKDAEEGESKDIYVKPRWERSAEFVLTLVGYSVGLGNIWRFPYLCLRNGGGAFLVPYFLFMLIIGMPLFYMEVAIGQFSGFSALKVWKMSPLFKGIGYSMMVISFIFGWYYITILAWILYYLIHSFLPMLPWSTCDNSWNTDRCLEHRVDSNTTGNFTWQEAMLNSSLVNGTKMTTPAEEFWLHNVLDITPGIHEMGGFRLPLVGLLVVSWLLVFFSLFKGIRSLGKVVYVTVIVPYMFLFVLLIRGVTLDGSMEGIKVYLIPEWHRLLEFKVWGEAMLQIFFSLGPAWGTLITMASYNNFHNNAFRDTLIVCITCGITSFIAGFVIFTIIGYMAHESGLSVLDVVKGSGPGLAFIAYPQALTTLPLSQLWSVCFFLMLLTVGLDTQFGAVETVIAGLVDLFPKQLYPRKTLVTGAVCVVLCLLGLPFTCRGGMYPFQIVDWYCATFSATGIALFECICVFYVYGPRQICMNIKKMLGHEPALWFKICWFGITPTVIVVIIIFSSFQMSSPTLGDYTYPSWAIAIGWVIAIISLVPIPLCAISTFVQQEGSFLQRLKSSVKPTKDWKPNIDNEHIVLDNAKPLL